MIGAAGELVLVNRVAPQPHPLIHQGGDCGACALGGALGLSAQDVYQRFNSQGITNPHEMGRCIRCAASEGIADRMIDTHAEWPHCRWSSSFGHPAELEALAWFNYVRMAVDAGYYGVAMVNYDDDPKGYETNHWVLICGARTKGQILNETLSGDVYLSCSAGKLNGWHRASDLLAKRGAYDVLFVRPKNPEATR